MKVAAMSAGMQQKKLKAVKGGDSLRIGGQTFRVNSVEPQEGSGNIRLELEGRDGGSVTFIGLPKAKVHLAAQAS